MDPSSSLVVRCPQCGQHGTWFAARWGPFCSERCRLVDLGRWFNEEHRLSRPPNAAACAARRPDGPVIVVDFGTPVTFDIIDARPAYIGGVIAPGLDAMRHYLHERTALLPEIEIARPPSAIGKSTVHAMQSGAYHGYRGLVLEILARIHEEMGGPAKTIATGGYAALIADGLPAIGSVEPHLTMQGLLRVAELNFPQ